MSEVMTPVAAVDDVAMPIDGEAASAATLRALAIQPLLNRTHSILMRLAETGTATGIVVGGLLCRGASTLVGLVTCTGGALFNGGTVTTSDTTAADLRGNVELGQTNATTTTFHSAQSDKACTLTVMTGDASIDYTGDHVRIFDTNGSNRAVNLTSGAGHPDGPTKRIIHGGTANALTIYCAASSAQIVVLQPGQERNCIRKNGRWY